ncbi:cysteine synthase A [Actinomycetaceae bacterium WB03_NA08]|uniref:Cysteine synthase n=1 Tax=Scrofimicrobium canadense TaxID=2652290 RepID=A0A6N7W9T8_9ACTO|nr:cysteine synthase A [Scrofimicrobium canadense]MSS85016.1 cysteine synthase A [Scrofimicrobium canadense]
MTSVHNNIVDTIGKTPLVRLNRLAPEGVTVLAKVESFNPGGSVKDRIAKAIIDAAEESGDLKPGGTIVEATSGNTGIALALVGAARGYHVVLTMPASMSKERRALMRAYGAELVLTDPPLGMKGAVEAANQILQERDGAVLASQFANPANPEVHRKTTAVEIWDDTDGDVDIFVGGIGTGGTITGVGEVLKAKKPEVEIIAVEPAESPLLTEGKAGPHLIQGIGANFVPEVLNQEIIDEVIPVAGEDGLAQARQAASEEGLLVGISSGAALKAALDVANRPESQGKTIVVLLPDTGERYLSTALYQDLVD